MAARLPMHHSCQGRQAPEPQLHQARPTVSLLAAEEMRPLAQVKLKSKANVNRAC